MLRNGFRPLRHHPADRQVLLVALAELELQAIATPLRSIEFEKKKSRGSAVVPWESKENGTRSKLVFSCGAGFQFGSWRIVCPYFGE